MPTFKVTTWNTQGDYTAADKAAVIGGFTGIGQVPVVFLQEGGVEKVDKLGDFAVFSGQGVGSKNDRCTMYVLVDAKAGAKDVLIQGANHNVSIGGGDAGRTTAAAAVGDTLFVSWHSAAITSNTDTSALIGAIEANPDYGNTYKTVVIGGDFNAAPTDLLKMIRQVNDRSKLKFPARAVVYSGKPTHSSGNEYDFFIVLAKALPKYWIDDEKKATMTPVKPSDHDPVQVSYTPA